MYQASNTTLEWYVNNTIVIKAYIYTDVSNADVKEDTDTDTSIYGEWAHRPLLEGIILDVITRHGDVVSAFTDSHVGLLATT